MSLAQVHKALISGRFTVISSILIAILMRLLSGQAWDDHVLWIVLGIQIGIALILLQVNHSFTIIRTKTMLPAVLYLLFTTTCPSFYADYNGSIVAFCILLCLLFLMDSYQNPDSQKNALNISLILTITSLLWVPLLFFFPLIWYGFYRFRCLNFKTFFSSLIGILIVYFFIFSWSIYKNEWSIFFEHLPHKEDFLVIQPLAINIQDISVFAVLFILFIFSGYRIYGSGFSEKIRTSTFLHYLYLISICIFILLLLQSEWKFTWALILYIPLSFVLSHYFTLSTKKITSWLLLFTFAFFLGMYVWQLNS